MIMTNLGGILYINRSELKRHRKWTDELTRRFLGEPDWTKRNPADGKSNIRLYEISRVEAVEARDDFKAAMVKIEARRLKRRA